MRIHPEIVMRFRERSSNIEMIQLMWATDNTFLKYKEKYACGSSTQNDKLVMCGDSLLLL